MRLLFASVGVLAGLTGPVFGATAARPNILWVSSEDHGQQMGCYGDPVARTPNVDALAARGMIFANVWSNHPVCAPARTAIITGLHANSSGGIHMRSMVPLPPEMKLFPELLRETGYFTTNNKKEDYNVPRPAATWDESSETAHWRNRRPGQPFFAVFNSTKSHESQIRVRPHTAVVKPADIRVPAYHPDTPEVRQDWAQYYDQISAADADAGEHLRELEADGLAEDTIVFYFADHGGGMPRSKRWPCDSGLRVPLVVYFPPKWRHLAPPDYKPGGKSDRLVSFVDFAPTVLSLAGVRPPGYLQGSAFAGEFSSPGPQYLYGARNRMDERQDLVRSVTDGRYVYLRNYFPHVSQGQHIRYQFLTPTTRIWREWFDASKTNAAQSIFWQVPKAPEELYDRQSDPDEVRSLASSPAHRAILERLRAANRAHLEAIRDVCFLPEGEMHARSAGSSPYAMARDDERYPLARIIDAAELASSLDLAAVPRLAALAADPDSAVRYWAHLGFLMRGRQGVKAGYARLQKALTDSSPHVRIVAAQSLAALGEPSDRPKALQVLGELIRPEQNNFFVIMDALTSIDALGETASPLLPAVRALTKPVPAPNPRFSSYIPSLLENIVPGFSAGAVKD